MDRRPMRGRVDHHSTTVLLQYKPPSVTLEGTHEVLVTHVIDPNNFHVQYVSKLPELGKLMQKMQNYCSKKSLQHRMDYFNVGQACVVQSQTDDRWYRGIITGLLQNKLEILFVDYGYRDYVLRSHIMDIIPEFMDLEVQAVGCSMANLNSYHSCWLPEHNVQIEDMLLDKSFQAKFIRLVNNDIACEVELTDSYTGKNVNELFGQQTGTYVPNDVNTLSNVRHRSGSGGKPPTPPGFSGSHSDQKVPDKKVGDGNWASGFRNAESIGMAQACYKQIDLLCGKEYDVLVVFVNSPDEFYVQDLLYCDTLEQMMDSLNKFYNSIGAVRCNRLQINDVGVAKYAEDRRWYRVKVCQFVDGDPYVQFVDYGNFDMVSATSMRVLNRDFLQLPAQAIRCKLADVVPARASEWSDSDIDKFSEIASDEKMKIVVVETEAAPFKLHKVLLRMPSSPSTHTTNNQLINMGLAKSVPSHNESLSVIHKSQPISGASLQAIHSLPEQFTSYINQNSPVNSKFDVVISWFNNPNDFFCQMVKQEKDINNMMESLQSLYSGTSANPGETFIEGTSCVSQFKDDGMWYRAVVVDRKPNKMSSVIYIDYGNEALVENSCLRAVHSRFTSPPKYALRCKLKEIEPMSGKWTPDANKLFESTVSNHSSCTVLGHQGGYHIVDIENQGVNVTNLLLSRFEACRPTDTRIPIPKDYIKPHLSVSSTVKVFVSYTNSPNDFWCQLSDSTPIIDQLLDDLAAEYDPAFLPLASPCIGNLCVAKFAEDDAFYRGKIISKNDDYHVLFVDYGNSQLTKGYELQRVVPKLLTVPQLAIHCTLQENLANFTDLFNELVDDKELICHIVSKGLDDQYQVDLSVGGVNICQTLASKLIKDYPDQGNMQGKTVSVYISYIVNPEEFYIHISGCEAKLEEIAKKCQSLAINAPNCERTHLKLDLPVLTKYSLDGLWYRAVVQDVSSTVRVLFVDFGNTETVQIGNIKQIPLQLIQDAPVAYRCSLTGVTATSQNAVKEFEALTQDFEMTCVFTSAMNVWLYRDKIDCTKSLVDAGVCSMKCVKYPVNKVTQQFKGYISHADAQGIYIQKTECTEILDIITETLSSLVPNISTTEHECCSKFAEDNSWYRCVIESIDSSGVHVRFIDFGNGQICKMNDVAATPSSLNGIMQCAIKCTIHGQTTLSQTLVEELLAYEEEITVTIVKEAPELVVKLTDHDGKDIPQVKQEPILTLPKPQLEKHLSGYITEVDDTYVYLQMATNEEQLTQMTQDLVDSSDKLSCDSPPESVDVGHYVCGKFSEDESWYRAKVLSVHAGKATVQFVDFGNVDSIDILTSVRNLPREFAHYPHFALKTQISNMPKVSSADIEILKSCEDAIDIEFLTNNEPYIVNLKRSDGSNVLKKALTEYQQPACPAGLVAVTISEVDGDVAYLQPDSQFDALQEFADQLQVYDEVFTAGQHALDQFDEGTLCCAKFSEDDAWYRGKLESVDAHTAVVRFVDYGNKETIVKSLLRRLPHEMLSQPMFTYACLKENHDIQVGCEVNVEFLSKTVPYHIRVLKDGAELDSPMQVSSYTQQKIADSVVSGVVSDIDIRGAYIQLDKEFPALEKLADDLQNYTDYFSSDENKLTAFTVGTPCCSIFSEDEAWYRGRIEEIQDAKVVVRFVDYGNKETVDKSTVYSVPPDMIHAPPFAYLCAKKEGDGLEIEANVTFKFLSHIEPYAIEIHRDGPSEGVLTQKYPQNNIPDDPVTGVVCEIDTSCVYIQLDSEFSMLEKLADDLQNYTDHFTSDENKLTAFTVGTPCCCIFSEDEAWYRGRIEEIQDAKVVVRFVDYGNKETVDKSTVYSVPPDMIHAPPFAYLCAKKEGDGLEIEANVTFTFTSRTEPYTIKLQTVGDDTNSTTAQDFQSYTEPKISDSVVTGVVCYVDTDGVYIQLDSEFSMLEKLADDLQNYTDYFSLDENKLTAFTVGTPCCCIFSEDEAWYRGRIEEIQDAKVVVRFVDYGNKETVDKSTVYGVPPDMIHAPPFAYLCAKKEGDGLEIEANVTFTFTSRTEPYTIKLQTVGDDTNSTTAQDFQSYTEPKISDSVVTGVVCYVDTDGVYIQLDSEFSMLEKLADDLQNYTDYFSLGENKLTAFTVGTPCCCIFSEDEAWYRGRIEEIQHAKVVVRFVDYGNKETVDKSTVYSVPPDMIHAPPFAYLCAKKEGDGLEIEANVTFTFTSRTEPYTIKLQGDDTDTVETIMYPIRHAPDKISTCEIMSISPSGILQIQLNEPELYTVLDLLFELDADLNNCTNHVSLAKNTPCCVKSNEDESWYRGIIVDSRNDEIEIKFVDFGTLETVHRDNIKPIPEDMLRIPPFAVSAKLRGVEPSANDIDKMAEASASKLVRVEFLSTTEPFLVNIWMDDTDMADLLCKNQAPATKYRSTVLEVGERHEVYVSHCVSPDLFSCQRVSMAEELEVLMTQVSVHCAQVSQVDQATSLDVGSPCIAKFTEDDEWYRGLIVANKALSYDVFFVDYGNTESVEKTRVLSIPAELAALACQALECSLAGIMPIDGAWTEEGREIFSASVLNKKVLLTVINRRDLDDKHGYSVAVLDMGINVADRLVSQGHAIVTDAVVKTRLASSVTEDDSVTDEVQEVLNSVLVSADAMPDNDSLLKETDQNIETTLLAYKREEIQVKSRMEVFVSHVASPSQFYVQLQSRQSALELLMEEMADFYNCHDAPITGDIRCDVPYVVYYEDTGEAYRVLVQNYDGESQTAEVLYVDYGQTVTVPTYSILAPMPQFMILACVAVECSLSGARSQGSGWSEEAKDAFKTMVSEKVLVADFLAAGDNSYIVHLLDMGISLHNILIERGLGVPSSAPLLLPDNIQRVFNTPIKEDFRKKTTAHSDSSFRFSELLYNVGDKFYVTVSHIHTPWWFACQPSASADDFHTMTLHMQRKSLLAPHVKHVEIGQACILKHDSEVDFHRCVVKSINDDDIQVYLVDIGKYKLVTLSDILEIDTEFLDLPQQAFFCSLNGVKPKDIEWTEQTITAFGEFVTEKVEIVIESINKAGIYNVTLINCDGSVSEQLLLVDKEIVADDDDDDKQSTLSKASSMIHKTDSDIFEDAVSASESTVSDYFEVSPAYSPKHEQEQMIYQESNGQLFDHSDGNMSESPLESNAEPIGGHYNDFDLNMDHATSEIIANHDLFATVPADVENSERGDLNVILNEPLSGSIRSTQEDMQDIGDYVESVIANSLRQLEIEVDADQLDTPLTRCISADLPDEPLDLGYSVDNRRLGMLNDDFEGKESCTDAEIAGEFDDNVEDTNGGVEDQGDLSGRIECHVEYRQNDYTKEQQQRQLSKVNDENEVNVLEGDDSTANSLRQLEIEVDADQQDTPLTRCISADLPDEPLDLGYFVDNRKLGMLNDLEGKESCTDTELTGEFEKNVEDTNEVVEDRGDSRGRIEGHVEYPQNDYTKEQEKRQLSEVNDENEVNVIEGYDSTVKVECDVTEEENDEILKEYIIGEYNKELHLPFEKTKQDECDSSNVEQENFTTWASTAQDVFLKNYPRVSFESNEIILGKVTHIVDPSRFSVQPVEYLREIQEHSLKMNAYCEGHEDSSCVEWADGDLCLVVADDIWCRGIIVSTHTDASQYTIDCVDIDKTTRATCTEIRPIPHHLVEMPVFTVRCSLSDVLPRGEAWTPSDTAKFADMCGDIHFAVHIRSYDPANQCYDVYLHDDNSDDASSINRLMLQHGRPVPDSYLDIELQVDAAFQDNPLLKEAFEKLVEDDALLSDGKPDVSENARQGYEPPGFQGCETMEHDLFAESSVKVNVDDIDESPYDDSKGDEVKGDSGEFSKEKGNQEIDESSCRREVSKLQMQDIDSESDTEETKEAQTVMDLELDSEETKEVQMFEDSESGIAETQQEIQSVKYSESDSKEVIREAQMVEDLGSDSEDPSGAQIVEDSETDSEETKEAQTGDDSESNIVETRKESETVKDSESDSELAEKKAQMVEDSDSDSEETKEAQMVENSQSEIAETKQETQTVKDPESITEEAIKEVQMVEDLESDSEETKKETQTVVVSESDEETTKEAQTSEDLESKSIEIKEEQTYEDSESCTEETKEAQMVEDSESDIEETMEALTIEGPDSNIVETKKGVQTVKNSDSDSKETKEAQMVEDSDSDEETKKAHIENSESHNEVTKEAQMVEGFESDREETKMSHMVGDLESDSKERREAQTVEDSQSDSEKAEEETKMVEDSHSESEETKETKMVEDSHSESEETKGTQMVNDSHS